jgi:hypothetical protein
VIKKLAAVCIPLACVLVVAPSAGAARTKPLPALTPVRTDALTRALARGQLTEAQYALERARSLFRPGAVRREFGDVAKPSPHDATPILRDLAVRFRFLSPADRAVARGILANRQHVRGRAPLPGNRPHGVGLRQHAPPLLPLGRKSG